MLGKAWILHWTAWILWELFYVVLIETVSLCCGFKNGFHVLTSFVSLICNENQLDANY